MEQRQMVDEKPETFEQFMASMRELRESIREMGESQRKSHRKTRREIRELRESQQKSQEAFEKRQEAFERELEESKKRREASEKRQEAFEKRQEIFEREMEESKKHREALEKRHEAFEREMKEYNKRFGEFTNRFGDIVEYMVVPNLVSKFKQMGFAFTKANRTKIEDDEHEIFMEIDALLENGDKVLAVEIKNKPSINDIDDHIERMEKLRFYADLHNDKRVYLGAVAGVVFDKSQKIYALKKGFYVIEPSGETFTVTEPTGIYHPHEW